MKYLTRRMLLGIGLCLAIGVPASVGAATPRAQVVPAAIARAPHAQPAIFRIDMAHEAVHSGQTVHASVLTSSNVASVEARIKGMGMGLTRVGVGKFALTYQVPWLPFFFRGDWPVNVIARNVDGVRAERTLKITYQ